MEDNSGHYLRREEPKEGASLVVFLPQDAGYLVLNRCAGCKHLVAMSSSKINTGGLKV